MRIFLAAALMLGAASCAWPPMAAAPPPSPPVALAPGASAPAAAPIPAPVLPVAYHPTPTLNLGLFGAPSGRLLLSNFSFDMADVEAFVTPYPDCAIRPGIQPMDFKLPLNASWAFPVPFGSDVCWRRQLPAPSPAAGIAAAAGWTPWNRAYTWKGRFIDAQL